MSLYDVKDLEKERLQSPEARRPVPGWQADGSFQYSDKFRRELTDLLRGMEDFPNFPQFVDDMLAGPSSRLFHFVHHLVPEIEYRCGSLRDMKVLDFGCGSGPSTIALAMQCKSVAGFDIDPELIDACQKRLEEHGLESRAKLYCAPSLEDVKDDIGKVDLILVSGVIEHIPLTERGLRRKLIRTLFSMLKKGGSLYVYDTPNRVWPYDFHTTGLMWIPWMKPGSAGAYDRAVRKGRYLDSPRYTPGPRGMEQCGAWGATYWEILRYLKGERYVCQNTLKGRNQHIDYLGGGRRYRLVRYPFDFFVGLLARPLRIPITAFYPFLDNLVIQRTGDGAGANPRPDLGRSARNVSPAKA
jgi:2-polyprenyl-3-methyl-5-hydroxy-6-metoxy-1,4-benzoquinol methylase